MEIFKIFNAQDFLGKNSTSEGLPSSFWNEHHHLLVGVQLGENFSSEGSESSDDGSSDEALSLPPEFKQLQNSAWPGIVAYSFVFAIASVGNLLEFRAVSQRLKKRCTPMNILLMNLCIADLIVGVAVAAVEVVWRLSIGWYAGDALCKGVHFIRTFGLYLSSLVLMSLSLDRYCAVLHPLKVVDAYKRVRVMLLMSWILAALLSFPQCIVFGVKRHPQFQEFQQCTSTGLAAETANTALSLTFMYFLPILVILFCYGNIIWRLMGDNDVRTSGVNLYLTSISTGNGDVADTDLCVFSHTARTGQFLRRSDVTLMDRAKIRALKLTSIIVIVFIVCWTPYVVISLWHIVDQQSAERLNPFLQDALFIMVVANSCANPLVYGVFHSTGGRRASSAPTNATASAYTMSTYARRSTKTLSKSRASMQTEFVDSPPTGHCVTHLSRNQFD